MKAVFPVIFTRLEEGGYMAFSPDFQINTQGETLADAIEMARDAIGIMGIDMEDNNKTIPTPSSPHDITCAADEIVSMIDIDFTAYRRANERRTVRRNVSLPSWLNSEAEKAGLNVSAILQAALKQELHITE